MTEATGAGLAHRNWVVGGGGLRCDEVSHGAARLSGSGSAGRQEAMISSRMGGRGSR